MTVALTAAKAYAQVQSQFAKSLSEVAGPASGAAPAGGLDFGHMVTGAMNEIAQTGKMAEKQMIAHANGKAELVVQDTASYQRLVELAERTRRMDALKDSLADMRAGRVVPAEAMLDEMQQILAQKGNR